MKRIAYLVSRYPAISHTFILREVRSLRELGWDVSVASINPPDRGMDQLAQEERDEVPKTFYVKAAGLVGALQAGLLTLLSHPVGLVRGKVFAFKLAGLNLSRLLYAVFYLIEAVMIGQWMKRQGIHHLHVHFATPAATVGLILSKIFPFTFSITVHGPDEFYDAPGYNLREKIEGASFVCCIGKFARSQLMLLSGVSNWGKFEVCPLGVDPALFTPRPFRSDIETLEVICVGRLVPAKGQHILLAALKHCLEKGRSVRLRFVGDGPDRKNLEELAAKLGITDSVVFEGAVNQDRIRELYGRADVFALPSFAEGIPVVLMEAMAMEIPCVTTRITGIPELIRNRLDGLLVTPSDDEALADALIELMDDPELRLRLGHAGRDRVIDKYNLDKNTVRLSETFERRLIGETSSGSSSQGQLE